VTAESFANNLTQENFELISDEDYSSKITRSAKRMYHAYLIGGIGSRIYNFVYAKSVSRFAKTHYLCGKYQYLALKRGLWQYHIFLARKKGE